MSGAARSESHADAIRAAGSLALADTVYSVVRKLVEGTTVTAAHNARRLLSLERVLGIDIERSVQRFVVEHPLIFAVFPVAPPRFMPGFIGTVSQGERQHFVPHPASWSPPSPPATTMYSTSSPDRP
jgi:hypothetical protein